MGMAYSQAEIEEERQRRIADVEVSEALTTVSINDNVVRLDEVDFVVDEQTVEVIGFSWHADGAMEKPEFEIDVESAGVTLSAYGNSIDPEEYALVKISYLEELEARPEIAQKLRRVQARLAAITKILREESVSNGP